MIPEKTNKCTCIYKISSKCKPKRFYIGSAFNFQARKLKHLSNLRRNVHINSYLQNHFNKYGETDLHFDIIEEVINKEFLIEREQFYIDTLSPIFNFCKVAGNCAGRIVSEHTRSKIRNTLTGVKHKEERRRNISNGHYLQFKKIDIFHKDGSFYTTARSRKEASKLTGAIKQRITTCCKNEKWSSNGYYFKYNSNDK
jgi:hypothetical protein